MKNKIKTTAELKKKVNLQRGFFAFTKGKIILIIIFLILLISPLLEIFYVPISCELYNKNIDDIKCSTMIDNLNIFNANPIIFFILILLVCSIFSYLLSCIIIFIYNKLKKT